MGKTWNRQKMPVLHFLFLVFLFLRGSLLSCTPALASELTKPKNILILFHGSPGQPLYDTTLSEVTKTIQKGLDGPLNLYVEYLDAQRFPEKHHVQAEFDFIKRKYSSERMDLFIPIGPNILPLVSQYLSPDFDKVPSVFIEFRGGYADRPVVDRKPNMTGLITEPDLQKTFELILSLHPGAREVFIITGSAPIDMNMKSIARDAYREYEQRIKVTYLSDFAMQELLQKINNLPKNGIGIYLSFTQDATGMNYYGTDALKLI